MYKLIQILDGKGKRNFLVKQLEDRKLSLPIELSDIKKVNVFDGFCIDLNSVKDIITGISRDNKIIKTDKDNLFNKESIDKGIQILELTKGLNEKKIEELFGYRRDLFLTGNNGYIFKHYNKIFESKESLESYVDTFYCFDAYLNQFETKDVEIFRYRKYLEEENLIIRFPKVTLIKRKEMEKKLRIISFKEDFFLDEITSVYSFVNGKKELIKKGIIPTLIKDRGTESYTLKDFLEDNNQFKMDIASKTHYIYNVYFESPEFNKRLDGKKTKEEFRELKPSWKKYIYNKDFEQTNGYFYKLEDGKKKLLSKDLKKVIIYNPLKGVLIGLLKGLEGEDIKERLLTPYKEKIISPLGSIVEKGYDKTVTNLIASLGTIKLLLDKYEIKEFAEIESQVYEIFFGLGIKYENVIEEIKKEDYSSYLSKLIKL